MVSSLKNRLVTETVFHTSFAATLKTSSGQTTFSGIKANHEVLLSFLRDPEEEEEFFLEVSSKKDDELYYRIPVDNIDEMEHVEGTLKFYLHFQRRIDDDKKDIVGKMGAMFRKKLLGKSDKEKYEPITEMLESKFVNKIIENFNSVLEIID